MNYARVVFQYSWLDAIVKPAGVVDLVKLGTTVRSHVLWGI